MLLGKTWLGQNHDVKTASPVVDHVKNMVGGTCTLFQRMDDQGNMLRVCTNVIGQTGTGDRHLYPGHRPRRKAQCRRIHGAERPGIPGEGLRGRRLVRYRL